MYQYFPNPYNSDVSKTFQQQVINDPQFYPVSITRSYKNRIFTKNPFPDIWEEMTVRIDFLRYPQRIFFFMQDDLCLAIGLDQPESFNYGWISEKFLKMCEPYTEYGIHSEIQTHLNYPLCKVHVALDDSCVEIEYHFFRKKYGKV